ncbi:MAG TPA: cyclic nucleotide-binding domain-containing protein [Anaerolineaceae bacterium]|jgi:CRP-like cAMP-binding protein
MYGRELAQLTLFHDFSPEQLEQIQSFVEICRFPKDQVIFEQGEQAQHLYIVINGEVVVRFKPYDGPDIIVTHITAGGVFGWSAALGRSAYTSSAITTTTSEFFRFRAKDLHKLCEQNPETGRIILDRLAAVIAERLHSTHNQILAILTQAVNSDSE